MSLPTEPKKIIGRSGYWAVWYDRETQRKKKRKLGEKIGIAKAALLKLQKEILNPPKKKEEFKNISLKEYFEIYKKDFLNEPGRQSWSGKQRMHFERFLLPAFGKRKLKAITLYDAESWYKTLCRKHPRKYCNHIARTFKTSLKRAEGKYLTASPIRNLKLLAEEKKIPETFTKKLVVEVLSKLTGRDKLFFALGVSSGLRKAELQFLQWKDIDLSSGRLFVRTKPEHRIKDCEDRKVPLKKEVLILLKQFKSETKPSLSSYVFEKNGGGVRKRFDEYVKTIYRRGGLKGNACNLMRHTFASMFLSQGGNLAELKSIMGHSTIAITEKNYAAYLPPEHSSIHDIDFGISSEKTSHDRTQTGHKKKENNAKH